MSQPARGLTLIIAAAGTVLSVAGFLFAQAGDRNSADELLATFAQSQANGIARVFAGHERLLRDVAAGRAILAERGSGLRAIEWNAVTADSGSLLPGRRVAGYDPASIPTLAVALASARDSGRPAISGQVGAGEVILVLPTYMAVLSAEATVENYRENLSGYATAAVSLGEALSHAGEAVQGLNFLVADEAAPSDQRMLHGVSAASDGPMASVPLTIAGRSWTVTAVAGPQFAGLRPQAPWVLATGLLATLVVAGFVSLRLKRSRPAPALGEGAVLSSLSHDIRDRLNTVIGFSEMMQEQVFGPLGAAQYEDYARNINDAGRVVLNKFNDLIDYSALSSGTARCSRDQISLAATLQDVAAMMQPLVNRRRNHLTVWVDDAIGEIVADERKLRQVLFNLGSFANKLCQENEIVLSGAREGERVALNITVKGGGLTRQQVARLFEVSPRDVGDARTEKGTGLDLVIARLLVELMGGKISVDSSPGTGTDLTVLLPAPAIGVLVAPGQPAEA